MVVLVPLGLGIFPVGFVLHVRNTLTSAAAEAARQAATADGTPESGRQRARRLIDGTVGSEYASDVRVERTSVDGYPGIEVRIDASVPALGVFGPGIDLAVEGHAVEERLP